ncbi:leucyl/phenylalanyl-tRNA--protein transferase [Kineosporia succinea]|uniref:Leucyl/phenylalanyl-tRNA--protein transferase n=1 Tax=Kineosporia succinea TaxID=84632 RepID=A0ABT9P6A0_9ACTN|nr:leucyl/phenylalanyl-tRNA--protein transferase [Kineosporia succinea]MDP9828221.1 leucyl/phenylalanyl-tRNA--protein transferase [Kineosporia succinea]
MSAQPVEPVEPVASRYAFDLSVAVPGEDLIGVGADLEPGTLLSGYRSAVFPMGLGRHGRGPIGWWSPDPRGVLPLSGLKVSRSLRKAVNTFEIRVDSAFEEVVAGCADVRRPGRWITPRIAEAYRRLHDLGWAHSVECWRDGRLAGGLYGVAIGGLFAGESMFHRETDASKVALVGLVRLLTQDGGDDADRRLLDVQWRTDHLGSLGVVEIPREDYRARLEQALLLPRPAVFDTLP